MAQGLGQVGLGAPGGLGHVVRLRQQGGQGGREGAAGAVGVAGVQARGGQFDHAVAVVQQVQGRFAAGQMAVLAGAILGACMGFLWFNCNPARVFMGDTGSLALGGLIGYIAIVIRQEIMLLIIGGVFAAEAISVMLQVGYFKYTRKRFGEGRRIFLMSPLHHHFQKKGWGETQVVVRFWLISAMLTALALATIKLL